MWNNLNLTRKPLVGSMSQSILSTTFIKFLVLTKCFILSKLTQLRFKDARLLLNTPKTLIEKRERS